MVKDDGRRKGMVDPTHAWADIYLRGKHTEGDCETCAAARKAFDDAVRQMKGQT